MYRCTVVRDIASTVAIGRVSKPATERAYLPHPPLAGGGGSWL
jgi:hypothetical protein